MNILVVGAGQLGSRHLQSLMKSSSMLMVYVVDQSQNSLLLAKNRVEEVTNQSGTTVSYHTHLDEIKNTQFFLTIIATSSAPRLLVLREVLERFESQNIILEKFLFQNLESYALAESLISCSKSSVFVNCPLRTYPIFKEIKKAISVSDCPIHMHYSGGQWVSLACNSIHYIDLLAFLGNAKLHNVDCSNIDSEIIPSKRLGYIEFTGMLTCEFTNKSRLELESLRGSKKDSTIIITFGKETFKIDELTGNYKYYRGTKLINSDNYDVPYQSDLTHQVLDQLVKKGTCDLSAYNESSSYHQLFLREMLVTYNKITKKDAKSLPIT